MAARTSYAVGALTALVVAACALLVALDGRAATPPPVRGPEPAPAAVLADWDARRADAWAAGDAGALAALYADQSRAGARDVAMLRRYLARGLRVEGLQMQRLVVSVVEHTGGGWVLQVRDRVVGGVVVGRQTRVALPRDRVTGHRVTLVRVDGTWRVAEVLPVGPDPHRAAGPVSSARPRSPS